MIIYEITYTTHMNLYGGTVEVDMSGGYVTEPGTRTDVSYDECSVTQEQFNQMVEDGELEISK